MAVQRKYAHLLEIDDAPEIYESMEPAVKSSQADSGDDSDSDTSEKGISKSRLRIDAARDKFDTARVDASKANFSDRVDVEKQSYIVSSRQRRTRHAPIDYTESEDSEEEDTDAALTRRIARLNRELEEIRRAVQKREGASLEQAQPTTQSVSESTAADLAALTRALDSVQVSQRDAISAHARLAAQLSEPFSPPAAEAAPTSTSELPSIEPVDAETLSQLAAFDTRLASLEAALGLDTSDTPPIFPTLSLLDRQLAILTSPSTNTDLEAKATAARALSAAAAALQPPADDPDAAPISAYDVAQLRSLYALLPTLTRLNPILDPLLTRLRSLRYLHADAAGTKDALDELERRQAETEQELRAWREGLAAIEQAVVRAEAGFKDNAAEVERWVAELEGRLR